MDATQTLRIQDALTKVLSDDKFLASPQMSAFLRYVVRETLAGNASRIKAYTVAVDALGKPTSFDPQNDPSVRVLANRLRSSLDIYYTNNPEQALFIELHRGSYVPHFIDSSGYEHVQEALKKEQRESKNLLQPRYEKRINLFAPATIVQHENTMHHDGQGSARSVNRVNSWLMGDGSKKYS